MPFHEAIAIAIASVKANKLRSILTILGVVIGIASVIAVVAITDAMPITTPRMVRTDLSLFAFTEATAIAIAS